MANTKKVSKGRLFISYDADEYWKDKGYDKKIAELIGVSSDGGGMGFGSRDLDFTFDSLALAKAALAKLRKAKLITSGYVGKNYDEDDE